MCAHLLYCWWLPEQRSITHIPVICHRFFCWGLRLLRLGAIISAMSCRHLPSLDPREPSQGGLLHRPARLSGPPGGAQRRSTRTSPLLATLATAAVQLGLVLLGKAASCQAQGGAQQPARWRGARRLLEPRTSVALTPGRAHRAACWRARARRGAPRGRAWRACPTTRGARPAAAAAARGATALPRARTLAATTAARPSSRCAPS